MQFIPLYNMKQQLRHSACNGSYTFTDKNGSTHSFSNSNQNQVMSWIPFYSQHNSSASSGGGTSCNYPYASSAVTIPESTTNIPDQVGTATVSYARAAGGWTATITITGTEDATIRHLLFSRGLWYGASYYEAVLYAVQLDSPVLLNADNNYTAHFTFAIEF